MQLRPLELNDASLMLKWKNVVEGLRTDFSFMTLADVGFNENRSGADISDSQGCGNEGVRGNNYLITGSDAQCF